jgi:hypothetical protein
MFNVFGAPAPGTKLAFPLARFVAPIRLTISELPIVNLPRQRIALRLSDRPGAPHAS